MSEVRDTICIRVVNYNTDQIYLTGKLISSFWEYYNTDNVYKGTFILKDRDQILHYYITWTPSGNIIQFVKIRTSPDGDTYLENYEEFYSNGSIKVNITADINNDQLMWLREYYENGVIQTDGVIKKKLSIHSDTNTYQIVSIVCLCIMYPEFVGDFYQFYSNGNIRYVQYENGEWIEFWDNKKKRSQMLKNVNYYYDYDENLIKIEYQANGVRVVDDENDVHIEYQNYNTKTHVKLKKGIPTHS